MPIKLGTTSIGIMYLGTTKIGKAYLGGTLVYESSRPEIIIFADPNVEAIAVVQWGNGTTLNTKQAAAVTTLSTYFQAQPITSFDELQYFTGLTSINGGQNNGAFMNCTSLESVVLPSTITSIGRDAFSGCSLLDSINFPSGLTSIGQSAFLNCAALAVSVDLPSTVSTLNAQTFEGSGITSVKLRISSFSGNRCFLDCTSLVSADLSLSTITSTYEPANDSYGTFRGCTSLQTVILPTTCTRIGRACFYGDSSLTSVTGTSGVTEIARMAFNGCTSLTQLDMSSVETIEVYSFIGTKLTELDLPNISSVNGSSVSAGGPFNNCTTITSVDLGSGCTNIGQNSFRGCSGITTFIVRAVTPPTLGANAFTSTSSNMKIYVPNGSGAAYQAATNWSSHASKINELDANGNIPV